VTAVVVGVVESISHVKQSVTVPCFAVTSVVDVAAKPALHAKNAVATTASTICLKRNVVSLAILVTESACGNADITHARNCVESFAIAQDVTCHVPSNFPAGIPVLVSVEKYARRSAECVTSRR